MPEVNLKIDGILRCYNVHIVFLSMIIYKAKKGSKLISENVHKTGKQLNETLTIVYVTIMRLYKVRSDNVRDIHIVMLVLFVH